MLDKIAYFAAGAVTGGLAYISFLLASSRRTSKKQQLRSTRSLQKLLKRSTKSEWEMALIQRIANPILSRWYRALLWTTLRLLWKIPTRKK